MVSDDGRRCMASVVLLVLFTVTSAVTKKPTALVITVTKDLATRQYVASLRQRTPLVPIRAAVDLGGSFFWVNCERGFVSSSSRVVGCKSVECAAGRSFRCLNWTACAFDIDNPFTPISSTNYLAKDVLVVSSTDGSNPGPPLVAKSTVFGCGFTNMLKGLAEGATGIVGLARNPIALPSQLTAKFNLRHRFAICLSNTIGAVFFGPGPYFLPRPLDASLSLAYTPLLVNPVSLRRAPLGVPSDEYFIGVISVKVNGKSVSGVNGSLLEFNRMTGKGGTRISTTKPYTELESSIFKVVVAAFAKESGLQAVPAVKPFGFCFDSSKVGPTRVGPAVPPIDLVLQGSGAVWRMFGHNSVVEVHRGVSCLAFGVTGPFEQCSIVLGGHQLEDNLLEFDLAASRLGFSSSLLARQTACSNFNFTAAAF